MTAVISVSARVHGWTGPDVRVAFPAGKRNSGDEAGEDEGSHCGAAVRRLVTLKVRERE